MNNLVIKFGTETLLGKTGKFGGHLDQRIFDDVARQVADLVVNGVSVSIVSSGSIKAGKEAVARLAGVSERLNKDLEKKQFAGIGARHLLNMWGKAFEKYNIEVAQIWITFANWQNKKEKDSICKSILNYHKCGIVPIINENDVVSDEEIKLMDKGISENDRLAQMISDMVGADAVLFLTSVGGVYDKNPLLDSSAKIYEEIDRKKIKEILKNESIGISKNGSGGMKSKISAAYDCLKKGKQVGIAGLEKDTILRFARGEKVGTRLVVG